VTALAEAAAKGMLPKLEKLNLSGDNTISQAWDALKAALPDCTCDLYEPGTGRGGGC